MVAIFILNSLLSTLVSYSTISAAKMLSTTIMQVYVTEREASILKLLSEGKTNKEVAKEIHISHWTVAFHVNEMLFKFNVPNRTSLVVYAIKNGLI